MCKKTIFSFILKNKNQVKDSILNRQPEKSIGNEEKDFRILQFALFRATTILVSIGNLVHIESLPFNKHPFYQLSLLL